MAEGPPAETKRRRSFHEDNPDSDGRDSEGHEEDSDEERAKEIEDLQKRGILPNDFPVKDGEVKYDNEDMTEELDELLALGSITKEEADQLKDKTELTNEVVLDSYTDPCVADHEQMLPPFASDGLPLNWSRDAKHDKLYNLVKLKKGEPEYDIISKEFEKVNIKVKGIERLQSGRQLKRFQDELEDMTRHRDASTFTPNIRYLYHGTSVDKTRICEEGLDQRLSRQGFFGKGIYFSDNPLKCVHYSNDPSKKNPDEAYILKCRVILGDAKLFVKGCYDTTLKREPEKKAAAQGWRYYDSVVGCPRDFNEFVVYENRRAMIEYIISFQVDKKMLIELRTKSQAKTSTKTPPSEQSKSKHEEPVVEDDHLARIAEVREAVRKKRLEEAGKKYVPPSEAKQQQDEETWSRLQKIHHVLGGKSPAHTEVTHDPEPGNGLQNQKESRLQHSVSPKHRTYLELQDVRSGGHGAISGRHDARSGGHGAIPGGPGAISGRHDARSGGHDAISGGHDARSGGHDARSRGDGAKSQGHDPQSPGDDIQQVLDFCVVEFLKVTDTDDKKLARYYVMKSKMDVNQAILMYYEDIG